MENKQNLQNELREIKGEIQKLQTRVSVIENQLNIQPQSIFQIETVKTPTEQVSIQNKQESSIFQVPNLSQQPIQRPTLIPLTMRVQKNELFSGLFAINSVLSRRNSLSIAYLP